MHRSFHIPVLRKEVAEYLITNPDGVYVDGTVGGGGHAEYIVNKLSKKAIYIAIDQDREAIKYAKKRLAHAQNIRFYHDNFDQLEHILVKTHIHKIDGLLLDLGVSSYQIGQMERGFSYMEESSPLDMRMNQSLPCTAADLVNNLDAKNLNTIFKQYGEERQAAKIANLIIKVRKEHPLETANHLRKIIDKVISPGYRIKSYARIFQALRIAVNNELENLKIILNNSITFLSKGARMVIISYHSLEDRIVKNFLQTKENPCVCPPGFPKCSCGRIQELIIINRKPIRPDSQELKENPRARSALMRVGEHV
jgi:16S rRNA (cytosine1402-N4)-methyltransferase